MSSDSRRSQKITLKIERRIGKAVVDNTTWYILIKRFDPPQEGFSEAKEFQFKESKAYSKSVTVITPS